MNPTRAIELLKSANGDEEKLTLAGIEFEISAFPADIHRLLKNAIFACCVPHWFGAEIIASLLKIPRKDALYVQDILSGFSFIKKVESRSAFAVHERYRKILLRKLNRDTPRQYRLYSRVAAQYFGRNLAAYSQVEAVFHALVAYDELGVTQLLAIHEKLITKLAVEELEILATNLDEQIREKRLQGKSMGIAIGVMAKIQLLYSSNLSVAKNLRRASRLLMKSGDKINAAVALIQYSRLLAVHGRRRIALRIIRELLRRSRVEARRETLDMTWLHMLSWMHDEIGELLVKEKRINEALRAFRVSLRYCRRLIKQHPRDTTWKRDMSVSLNKIGDICLLKERFSDATDHYRLALRIRRKLAKRDPGNLIWLRDYSVSLNRLASAYEAKGQLTAALRGQLESWRVAKRLARLDPRNMELASDVAISLMCIGNIYKLGGHMKMALKKYAEALGIMERLMASDPTHKDWGELLNDIKSELKTLKCPSAPRH